MAKQKEKKPKIEELDSTNSPHRVLDTLVQIYRTSEELRTSTDHQLSQDIQNTDSTRNRQTQELDTIVTDKPFRAMRLAILAELIVNGTAISISIKLAFAEAVEST